MFKVLLMLILSLPILSFAQVSGRLRNFKKVLEPTATIIREKASSLIKNSELFCSTVKRGNISPKDFGDLLDITLDVYEAEGLAGSKRYILYNRDGAYDTSYTLTAWQDLTAVNWVHFAQEVYLGNPQYDPKMIDMGDCE